MNNESNQMGHFDDVTSKVNHTNQIIVIPFTKPISILN